MTQAASRAGRVLLVDDKPEIRLLLRARLEIEDDLEVVGEAANGEEARELTEILAPDLIVLDVAMPVRRGDEAIPDIRRVSGHVGIVVYSGDPAKLEGSAAPDAVVSKGRPLGELVVALREITKRRAHDVLRIELGSVSLPLAADGFDAMAGLLTNLVETADRGGDAVPGLVGTSNAELRALLGIYAHLGFSLRSATRAREAELELVVHAFRGQAAMARRALLAFDSAQLFAMLDDDGPVSDAVASAVRTINTRLLAALPTSSPGGSEA